MINMKRFTSKKQYKIDLNNDVGGFWCEKKRECTFHWRKCYCGLWTRIFAINKSFKLKRLNDGSVSTNICSFLFHKTWVDDYFWITSGLLWCLYQRLGLSFWRHPFTAEDSFVSKWCNAKCSFPFFCILYKTELCWINSSYFSLRFRSWKLMQHHNLTPSKGLSQSHGPQDSYGQVNRDVFEPRAIAWLFLFIY